MQFDRPRGRSFRQESDDEDDIRDANDDDKRRGRRSSEDDSRSTSSSSSSSLSTAEDDSCDPSGPVMYDPSLFAGEDMESFDDEHSHNHNQNCGDNNSSNSDDEDDDNSEDNQQNKESHEEEEDEELFYSRGRSRSRSVHSLEESHQLESGGSGGSSLSGGTDGVRRLSLEEVQAQVLASQRNSNSGSGGSPEGRNSRGGGRTGALKQREVMALEKGLQEATLQKREEDRLEEQAEIEAAKREKQERSVSIGSLSGRGSHLSTTPIGSDPPMRRVKILLLGDSSVGKSSLIQRLTDNTFKPCLVSTVGVDYKVRKLHLNGTSVQVQLWDTAGSEKFHKITTSYYRGVHGIMLVFDVSNRKSFKHVSYWLSNISKYANENVQVTLVGNKVDLRPVDTEKKDSGKINKFIKSKTARSTVESTSEEEVDPFVHTHEGQAVASKYHIQYAETSALSNTNIEESLTQCVKQVLHHMDNPTLISSLKNQFQKRDSKHRAASGERKKSDEKMREGDKQSRGDKEKCIIS